MERVVTEVQANALALHRLGFNVVPAKAGEKRPSGSWGQWMSRVQTEEDVLDLFDDLQSANYAAICGARSVAGRGYLLALDADDSASYDFLKAQMAGSGAWQRVGGRGGQLILLTPTPIKPHKRSFSGSRIEVRSYGQVTILPPSIHSSGAPYRWVERGESLPIVTQLPFATLMPVRVAPSELPRLARQILNGQVPPGRYRSRSEIDAALVASLSNAGVPVEQILHLIQTSDYESHIRKLSDRNALIDIERIVGKVAASGHKPAFLDAQAMAQCCRKHVRSLPVAEIAGNRRTGTTDRAVLLAHIAVVERTGKNDYHLSAREGAELAQVTKVTFSFATQRLLSADWLKVDKSRDNYAHRYSLVPPPDCTQSIHSFTPGTVSECIDGVREQERQIRESGVFGPAGLGRHIYDTWQVLSGSLMTVEEVAQATGKHIRTIRRHIRILERYRLVIRDGKKLTASSMDINWCELGAELGALDHFRQRMQRHQRERRDFRRVRGL